MRDGAWAEPSIPTASWSWRRAMITAWPPTLHLGDPICAFCCQVCGQLVYFDNSRCIHCRAILGFLPDSLRFSALDSPGLQCPSLVTGSAHIPTQDSSFEHKGSPPCIGSIRNPGASSWSGAPAPSGALLSRPWWRVVTRSSASSVQKLELAVGRARSGRWTSCKGPSCDSPT